MVLTAIRSIPHEINVVFHPGVPVYSDRECQIRIHNVKGLILETTSPGGAQKNYRIYPTTRDYYEKGMTVTWEWSMNNTWGKSYYKDPIDGEIKSAWCSSAEFIGRDIEKI